MLHKPLLAGLIVILLLFTTRPASAKGWPDTSARAVAVWDANVDQPLWQRNADARLPMASLTKIMTALLVLEHTDPNETVTIPDDVLKVDGTRLYLTPGTRYREWDLLQGLMLMSANDAAIALAVHVAGSVPAFVQLMNDRATALGLTNTHFANPDGLDDAGHYASANDLARLTLAAMANPKFTKLVAVQSATIAWPEKGQTRTIKNINEDLGIDNIDGVKTGYTTQAKNCIVLTAHANGKAVVVVILGEPYGGIFKDGQAFVKQALSVASVAKPTPTVPPAVTLSDPLQHAVKPVPRWPLALLLLPISILLLSERRRRMRLRRRARMLRLSQLGPRY